MKKLCKTFLTAVMFFTRIPCPSWVDHSEEELRKSRRYLPMIGWIVGALSAITYSCARLVFPASISIISSMVASILVTGALHEDGFADMCDGFGGGYNQNQILTIMKDSRIGSYGAIGVVFILALKYSFLYEIAERGNFTLAITLIASHSLSRLASLILIRTHTYVRDDDKTKSKAIASAKLSNGEVIFAGIAGIAPLLLFQDWRVFAVVALAYITETSLGSYFKKSIGGYTGDCLGAMQQVCELVTYGGLLVIWKFT